MQDLEKDTDPVEATDDGRDLYGISTWEKRSYLDTLSVALNRILVRAGKALGIVLALGIILAFGWVNSLVDPAIGVLTARSAIPALALAASVVRVRYQDISTSKKLCAPAFVSTRPNVPVVDVTPLSP